MLAVDPTDFQEVMGNLIDNAHKWAKTMIRIESRLGLLGTPSMASKR